MHLSRTEIVRHLALALEQEDNTVLRDHVEKLYHACTRKETRPNVAKHPPTWREVTVGLRKVWRVTCHREDAKFVEELWADFRARKPGITGVWKTRTSNGRISPVSKDGAMITFEFFQMDEVLKVKQRKGKKEVNKKKLASDIASKLTKEDILKLLSQL